MASRCSHRWEAPRGTWPLSPTATPTNTISNSSNTRSSSTLQPPIHHLRPPRYPLGSKGGTQPRDRDRDSRGGTQPRDRDRDSRGGTQPRDRDRDSRAGQGSDPRNPAGGAPEQGPNPTPRDSQRKGAGWRPSRCDECIVYCDEYSADLLGDECDASGWIQGSVCMGRALQFDEYYELQVPLPSLAVQRTYHMGSGYTGFGSG